MSSVSFKVQETEKQKADRIEREQMREAQQRAQEEDLRKQKE